VRAFGSGALGGGSSRPVAGTFVNVSQATAHDHASTARGAHPAPRCNSARHCSGALQGLRSAGQRLPGCQGCHSSLRHAALQLCLDPVVAVPDLVRSRSQARNRDRPYAVRASSFDGGPDEWLKLKRTYAAVEPPSPAARIQCFRAAGVDLHEPLACGQ
jgi:hypothetical protein